MPSCPTFLRELEISGLILYGVMSGNMRDMYKYIVGEGGFLTYLKFFDTDHDGKISKAEFEADPMKFREQVFQNAALMLSIPTRMDSSPRQT